MPRYKLTIEYDGTGLYGWQAQKEFYSVQAALEAALLKATEKQIEVFGSGRTDAGVHATAQIAHVDIEAEWDEFRLKEAINFYLRQDEKLPIARQVVVLKAEKAQDEFNARFDAKRRSYIYRIINRREHLALEQARAWHVPEILDAEKMNKAAQVLVGQHDFTSFRSTECQAKSPVKTLEKIEVIRSGELIEIKVSARSFLHHQVRNIAGSLRLIGNGKWQESDLKAALEAKDRTKAGETAPAHALYLVKVDYDK